MQRELGANLRDSARQELYRQCDLAVGERLGESVTEDCRDRIEHLLVLLAASYGISRERITGIESDHQTRINSVRCLVSMWMPDKTEGEKPGKKLNKRIWHHSPHALVRGIRKCPALLPYFPTPEMLREIVASGTIQNPPKSIAERPVVPHDAEELARQWEHEGGGSERQTPDPIGAKRMRQIITTLSKIKTVDEAIESTASDAAISTGSAMRSSDELEQRPEASDGASTSGSLADLQEQNTTRGDTTQSSNESGSFVDDDPEEEPWWNQKTQG